MIASQTWNEVGINQVLDTSGISKKNSSQAFEYVSFYEQADLKLNKFFNAAQHGDIIATWNKLEMKLQ